MFLRLSSFLSHRVILKSISLIAIFFAVAVSIQAQDLSDVKANQKKIKAEISLTQKYLKELKADKVAGLTRFNTLQRQLNSRTQLVKQYELELDMILAEIVAQEADIKLLKERLDKQKVNFKSSLKEYHKLKTTWSPMAFILSSSDLSTAWKRLTFYQNLSKHHRSQAEKLKTKEAEFLIQLDELKNLEETQRVRLTEITSEQKNIEANKKASQAEISRLKNDEVFLQKRLEAQQAQSVKLAGLLQKLVAANIKKRTAANELPSAAKKLNAAFGANKGRLPWPVAKGYIGRKFGKQRHPELKMIYINNNGIDILTDEGEAVKAVFEGKVTAVQTVAGFQQTILINHGSYYTVYANVDNVAVSSGETIKRGQTIAYTASSDVGANLHFELWKGKNLENPAVWLVRK